MAKRFFLLLALTCTSFLAGAQNLWPEFYVRDLIGTTHKFSHYAPDKGVTLFVFWRTCCPNNITMIDSLCEVWQQYDNPSKPIRIVLVALDDPKTASKVAAVVSTCGWEWEVIMDRNGEVARRYNVIVPPGWVAVNPHGEVVFQSKITSGILDSAIYFEELVRQIG